MDSTENFDVWKGCGDLLDEIIIAPYKKHLINIFDNIDGIIEITVNDKLKKLKSKWFESDGKANGSVLQKMIMGTEEGLQGVSKLTIDEDLFPAFDLIVFWFEYGIDSLQKYLNKGNFVVLVKLASYFDLKKLLISLQKVYKEAIRQKQMKERVQMYSNNNSRIYQNRGPKCSKCFTSYTPPDSYRGDYPICHDCRAKGRYNPSPKYCDSDY